MSGRPNSAGNPTKVSWVLLAPRVLEIAEARLALCHTARQLTTLNSNGTAAQAINGIREERVAAALDLGAPWSHELALCINVLCDLVAQGWLLRVDQDGISTHPPATNGVVADDKDRIRAAHVVERDAQLRHPAVRKFIREMERRRIFGGEWHSVFSLMRDGRTLAESLRSAAQLSPQERVRALRNSIDPYVEVVTR